MLQSAKDINVFKKVKLGRRIHYDHIDRRNLCYNMFQDEFSGYLKEQEILRKQKVNRCAVSDIFYF